MINNNKTKSRILATIKETRSERLERLSDRDSYDVDGYDDDGNIIVTVKSKTGFQTFLTIAKDLHQFDEFVSSAIDAANKAKRKKR